jgi:hypothetical protein
MKKFLILLFIITSFSCGVEDYNRIAYENEMVKMLKLAEKQKYNTEIGIIIDYSIHSGNNRGFLVNISSKNIIKSFLVAHGSGMGEKKGVPSGFSNIEGSNASSLGMAVIDGRDYSNWGINVKYWLKGLDTSNYNLRKRVVVLHSWEGIPDNPIYPSTIVNSQGCPTVSNNSMRYLDNLIKKQNNKKILVYSIK